MKRPPHKARVPRFKWGRDEASPAMVQPLIMADATRSTTPHKPAMNGSTNTLDTKFALPILRLILSSESSCDVRLSEG